jgi:starch-binding outer membrane protein, SusD/RagB family
MKLLHAFCALSLVAVTGCKKYLDAPLPVNEITTASVYTTDISSAAALNSIYNAIYNESFFAGPGSVGYMTGSYGDELRNLSSQPTNLALYQDGVSSTLGGVTGLWTEMYTQMYSINLAIENLPGASGTSVLHKDQWLGEAYFLRGLTYFYLTNLYGTVPLVLSSNYAVNNVLARSPQSAVYMEIIADLLQAQTLLSDDYYSASGATTKDRGRPNRMAASALLARAYLYTGDWKDAEAQADSVIGDVSDYQLVSPLNTFLIGSPEIIWGIEPDLDYAIPYIEPDVAAYYVPAGIYPPTDGVGVCLSDSLVGAFEPGDLRYTEWVGADSVAASGSTPAAVYYYAYKFKAFGSYTTAQEVIPMCRLAEQYLIRAEARAQQNNLTGALADLNAVRARAGLPASTAVSQADVLAAIQRERRVELFTELGNRFFDLRRTGNLDAVMNVVAPLKGGSWSSYKEWWPIPLSDIQNDNHLTQTPGFE